MIDGCYLFFIVNQSEKKLTYWVDIICKLVLSFILIILLAKIIENLEFISQHAVTELLSLMAHYIYKMSSIVQSSWNNHPDKGSSQACATGGGNGGPGKGPNKGPAKDDKMTNFSDSSSEESDLEDSDVTQEEEQPVDIPVASETSLYTDEERSSLEQEIKEFNKVVARNSYRTRKGQNKILDPLPVLSAKAKILRREIKAPYRHKYKDVTNSRNRVDALFKHTPYPVAKKRVYDENNRTRHTKRVNNFTPDKLQA